MIIQVRTGCDLLEMLKMGLTAAWKTSKGSLRGRGTSRVHVVNWDGTLRIEGDYSEERSIENHPDHPPGRTVIAFTNGRIVCCRVEFPSPQNPVSYHPLGYEESTRAEPTYAPLNGRWPVSAREEIYEDSDE